MRKSFDNQCVGRTALPHSESDDLLDLATFNCKFWTLCVSRLTSEKRSPRLAPPFQSEIELQNETRNCPRTRTEPRLLAGKSLS